MSTLDIDSEVVQRARTRYAPVLRTAGRAVFGDRTGLILFLVGLWLYVLTWRVGFLINDTGVLANMLVSLSHGNLHMSSTAYAPRTIELAEKIIHPPGSYAYDGRVYGRNYGQLAFALPFLWVFQALVAVVEPALALVVLWCAIPLAVGLVARKVVDLGRLSVALGASLSVLLLGANVSVGIRPLYEESPIPPILALQASTMVAAGLAGVVLYRLLAAQYDRRLGFVGGLVALVATPLGFWAVLPKRHALTTLFALVAFYALYRSRHPDETTSGGPLLGPLGYRSLAYAAAGLFTWVHAVEGFLLFLAVATADLPTAPRNDRRTLATLAVALFVSMLPFFVTNVLIFDSPLTPPRLYDHSVSVVGGEDVAAGSGGGTGGETSGGTGGETSGGTGGETSGGTTGGGGTDGSGLSGGLLDTVLAPFSPVFALLTPLVSLYSHGIEKLLTPKYFVETFVRSGYHGQGSGIYLVEGTNLTVLESAPVLGTLLAAPFVVVRAVVREFDFGRFRTTPPGTPVDYAAVVYVGLLVGLFMSRLPNLPVQVTVRYLTPLYPIGVYLAFRLTPLRRSLREYTLGFFTSYGATILVGFSWVMHRYIEADGVGKGWAFQLHARLALLAAALLAVVTAASAFREKADWATATAFGIAAGLGTAFILAAGVQYLHYEGFVVPIVRVFSAWLGRIIILG